MTRPEGDKNRKKKNTPEGIKRRNIFVFSRYSLIKVKILQQWEKKIKKIQIWYFNQLNGNIFTKKSIEITEYVIKSLKI